MCLLFVGYSLVLFSFFLGEPLKGCFLFVFFLFVWTVFVFICMFKIMFPCTVHVFLRSYFVCLRVYVCCCSLLFVYQESSQSGLS